MLWLSGFELYSRWVPLFKFHSDCGRVIGKIKQNELDAMTQPL